MIYSLLALLPLLLTAVLASPTPMQKRYTGVYIVSARTGKCLSSIPRNGVGAPVFLNDCSNTVRWDINPGSGSVIVSGTQLALDAGTNPGDGQSLKIWTSYPGLYQQTWYLTNDNRIAITGGTQCLDDNGSNVQQWTCTTGNTNQIFYIQSGPTPPPSSSVSPPPSSSSQPPPASSSATPPPPNGIPVGTVYPDPPNGGRRLHPLGRNDLCLTVLGGSTSNGNAVAVTYCFANDSPDAQYQLWDLPARGTSGLVKLHNQNYCFDAGSNPGNNIGLKIWTCYSGLFQQTWNYSNDNKLSLTNNQCVDVREGSVPGTQRPYNSLRDVQTYQCYAGNTNQIFQLYQ